MRVGIVHYWLVGMRGGEKVLEGLLEVFPEADIFTHVYCPERVSESIKSRHVHTTFIQRLPKASRWYRAYLPLMPLALEQLDLRGYDVVISSESGPAKGVLISPHTRHICYCHTPMRYVWDLYSDYRQRCGWVRRMVMVPVTHYLRLWDTTTALRVDRFIANSTYVAKRIWRLYRREAPVVHPPVDVESFCVSEVQEDYYLVVGELVDYKRVELAIRAFAGNGRRLVVIGGGERLGALRKIAPPNVMLLGHQPFEVLREHYSRCRALIFPGEEDFGIVPVEAMASGRPVIAYGRGGVLDSVVPWETGIFFHEQTPEALNEAIETFERHESCFRPAACRRRAMEFSPQRFQSGFLRAAGLLPESFGVLPLAVGAK